MLSATPGSRIVHVFLVLEADVVGVPDVEECPQHPTNVEHAPPDFDRLGSFFLARQVLEVHVVEPGRARADRLGRVDAATGGMPHVDAYADPLVVLLDRLPDVERRGPDLVFRPVVVDGQLDVELLDHLVQDRQGSRVGLQTMVGMPASRAYSNALRISASSSVMVMSPQLRGVMPASRNFCSDRLALVRRCS